MQPIESRQMVFALSGQGSPASLGVGKNLHAIAGVRNTLSAKFDAIGGAQASNVLQHRLTTCPFVVALMGAQAVTHRHADHIIAVPNPVRSQAVAIAE